MDPDKRIIEVLHIPSLHLLLGVVDKLLQELKKRASKNWVDKYLKKVNIVRKSYQGQHSLEGNQCSEFLKKLDILERELMKESTGLNVVTLPILQVFCTFRKVQKSCFGMEVKPDFRNQIAEFSRVYRSLEISVTPKVHIIERHIKDFYDIYGKEHGLGFWSEQPFEAMHHEMKVLWNKVKIKDISREEYGVRLLDLSPSTFSTE